MVVKSCGGLIRPVADFGGLGGPAGGLADWRTSGGLLADRSVLLATPREGHNSQFSTTPRDGGTSWRTLAGSGGLLADWLADFGGLADLAVHWRT
eukprot:gene7168-biopygen257